MASVAERLEELARALAPSKVQATATPRAQLGHQIALLVERLERFRAAHRRQLRSILREECRIGTDLKRILSYEPRIYQHSSDQRLGLKRRLQRLGTERRQLTCNYERDAADQQDRLFKLLWQYMTLGRADR